MSKAFFSVIVMIIFSFTGCIENSGDELQVEDTVEPTGVSDLDSLERRISALENETEELRRDNDKLGNRIVDLEIESHNLSESYNLLIQSYNNLSEEIVSLQEYLDNLSELGANNSELSEQIEELERKIIELEYDVDELNNFRDGMYNQLYLLRDLDTRPVEVEDWGPCVSGCGLAAYDDFDYMSVIFNSFVHEDVLYFIGENNGNGSLWRTDGTGFGTFKVLDADVDKYTSFYPNSEGFFFKAYDESYEEEIWFSDGQSQNTYRVSNDYGNSNYNGPKMEVVYNDYIFFTTYSPLNGGSYSLWKTNMNSDQEYIRSLGYMYNFHATSYGFFFQGSLERGNSMDQEIWFSDGTEEGTRLVKDINPNGSSYFPASFVMDDILYFSGKNGNNERELWRSDGTENGTYMVLDLNGNQSANINSITESGGRFYFKAEDGGETHFWSSNGSEEGTFIVKANITGSSAVVLGSNNNLTYFTINDYNAPVGAKYSVWSTEGYENTTVHLFNSQFSIPLNFALVESVLYFNHYVYGDDLGRELWRMDLDNNATALLHDIYPGEGHSNPTGFVKYKNKLFFGAYEPAFGAEIWYITV